MQDQSQAAQCMVSEHLDSCPICASRDREIFAADLTDTTFGCVQGDWTLWKCSECGCAYLDPRPTEESISLAYTRYYTHSDSAELTGLRGLYRKLVRYILNDIMAWRLKCDLTPRLLGGRMLPIFIPRLARLAETHFRHLPTATAGAMLLDVGCGTGAFLHEAERMNYESWGLEPDSAAIKIARTKGLRVIHGSLPAPDLPKGSFSHVTLSHVIEHLHNPLLALQEIHSLLRPGGRVWLSTPNIDSPLSAHFRENWRGLEAPRHLAIFTPDALVGLLEEAGFHSVKLLPPNLEAGGMACASFGLAQRAPPPERFRNLPADLRSIVRAADNKAWSDYRSGESLIAVGFKKI